MKNREIKFRAWDKIDEIMLYRGVYDRNWYTTEHNDNEGCHCYKPIDPEDKYNLMLMQFTGLKDKNGVEIYEGDILSHNDNKFVVKMSNNLFVFVLSVILRPPNWRDLAWCNDVSNYIEIIGNIHENPELLTNI